MCPTKRKIPRYLDLVLFFLCAIVGMFGLHLIDPNEDPGGFWLVILATSFLFLGSSLVPIYTREQTRPGMKPIQGRLAVASGMVGAVVAFLGIVVSLVNWLRTLSP